ncbi:MAG TPA: hypothetical protein VK730_01685 [Solirubrobacteraceae bacterium]|nr:hypothetical protein [Solirubrobacteraceae bacterium]
MSRGVEESLVAVAEQGRLCGYEARDLFYEIGTPSALRETEALRAAWRGRREGLHYGVLM